MKSYSDMRTDYGVESKNTSVTNLTYGDGIMNGWIRRLLAKADWPFLHRLRITTTTGSATFVNLPYDVDQVESVFVTSGSTRYSPLPASSRKFWDELHYSSISSDVPEYWFIYNGQIGLWPTPATTGNVISLNAKVRVIDLNTADITGTVVTLTSGSTAVELTGGLTDQMVGFWIRPTYATDDNKGDGVWYEIASVASGTAATLVRSYGGNTIAAGTATCTIGQMSLLPETFQSLPVEYASFRYWSKEKDERAKSYALLVNDGVKDLMAAYSVSDLGFVLDSGEDSIVANPNLFINL